MSKMILASSSPRRKMLLELLGQPFEIISPEVEEKLEQGELPKSYVLRNSMLKANWVKGQMKNSDVMILAADTIVCVGQEILEKPRSEPEAVGMLTKLSGNVHRVLTGYALLSSDQVTNRCIETEVHFRTLTAEEIEAYVKTGEPMDKAGSYAAQGIGSAFIKRINGSYTNVIGLPLAEVAEDLAQFAAGSNKPK